MKATKHYGHTETAKYRELVGITPAAFDLLVAVMAHERVYGVGCTRSQAAATVGVVHVNAQELLRSGWLTADMQVFTPQQILTATNRAWRNLWPWRDAWPDDRQEARRTA